MFNFNLTRILQEAQLAAQAIGIDRLAEMLETSANRLRKKLNPNDESHPLTMREFFLICQMTNNSKPVQEMAASLGLVCIQSPSAELDTRQICFMDLMLELGKSKGDVCNEMGMALSDGRICTNDVHAIRAALNEMKMDIAQFESALDLSLKKEQNRSFAERRLIPVVKKPAK